MGLNYEKFKKLFKRVKPIAKYYNLDQDLSNIDIPIINKIMPQLKVFQVSGTTKVFRPTR